MSLPIEVPIAARPVPPIASVLESIDRIARELTGNDPTSLLILRVTALLVALGVALLLVAMVARLARRAFRRVDRLVNREVRRSGRWAELALGPGRITVSQIPFVSDRIRAMTSAGRPDVVRTVDYIIQNAVAMMASDIHFDPKEHYIALQFRVDGILYDVSQLPHPVYQGILTRIKVLSNLKTYVREVPQDGRIRSQRGESTVDLRVSLMPTLHGEKIMLRILQREGILYTLETLGFNPEILSGYLRLLSMPQGILFLTGPTGSGKTTTIYSSLKHIKETRGEMVKLVTIEDPIEYDLDFLTQTMVNEATEFTFARGLRSILRQDPDVIMVGEIRDLETAQIAIQAGLTGHLLFTSVHANSSAGVFSRLINMGIEPFLLAGATLAVLSQRLVRKLCPRCRVEAPAAAQEVLSLAKAGLDDMPSGPFFTARGCESCLGKGYLGRVGLFEVMVTSEALRDRLVAKAPSGDIDRLARQQGMATLLDDGIAKARSGVTSIAEVMRVALA